MKKLLITILITSVLIGCKSPETVAYRTIGSIALAVNTAKHLYEEYRDGANIPVTRDQDLKIKSLYVKYQLSMKTAEAAEKAFKAQTLEKFEMDTIINNTITIANELINNIRAFNLPVSTI